MFRMLKRIPILRTAIFLSAIVPIASQASIPEQTTTLPKAERPTYSEVASFDTFVVRSRGLSKNSDAHIIVKDDNYAPAHRIAFLGFDMKDKVIPGLTENLDLKLKIQSDKQSIINVHLVEDHHFWNTQFTWNQKPQLGTIVATFSTSDRDNNGWITIPLNTMAIKSIQHTGKLSVALSSTTWRAYNSFSATESGAATAPTLTLTYTGNIVEDGNNVRFVKVVAAKEENGFRSTRVGEFNLIDTNGNLLSRDGWEVTDATTLNGWQKMFDGNHASYWNVSQATPNYFKVDLGQSKNISAAIYTPPASGYYGRVKDLLVYGSSDGNDWRLIASRRIPRGNGNAPHIAFSGDYATLPQAQESQTIRIKPSWWHEKYRLRNSAGRSPLNTIGLWSADGGIVSVWVSNTQSNDYIEIREGHWAGSQKHQLSPGLNAFKVGAGARLMLRLESKDSNDKSREAHTRIMATGVLRYPVFKSGVTTSSDWLDMLANYAESNTVDLVSENFILSTLRSDAGGDIYNDMQSLLDTYEEVLVPAQLAAGIDADSINPLHLPDDNPYNFVTSNSGYMVTYTNRMTYRNSLTRRMINEDEARSFWGIWHEIGHNLEMTGIEWPGQSEVATNIYAFAARAYNTDIDALSSQYDAPFQRAFTQLNTVSDYSSLPRENREMFYHHFFFLFGETFMYELHQRYRENLQGQRHDPEFSLDGTAEGAMNIMAIMTSKIAKKNLVELFEFWKMPLTQQTINTINGYNFSPISNVGRLPSQLVEGQSPEEFDMRF
ncbi:M60 family metallopeptidase [Enterovibrio norvegicus]|uniref:M60 family metallopeptidase n=1 Tax=Enterovibrio norvegicus TaxID=188144 RepID=UPI00354CA97D